MYDKILLVEDNKITAQLYAEILQANGYNVDHVADGLEAINKMKKHAIDYNLILMDIQMPKLNGYDSSLQLRKLGITTPIIAMSANACSENSELIYLSGMNGFIPKPISINKLNSAIERMVF